MNKHAILAFFLVGCSSGGDGGIWAIELPYDDTYDCADTVTHNFTEGYTLDNEEDGGDWTNEESTELSPQLFFAQIETYGSEAIMLIGTEAYPGTANDSGGWNFSWSGSTTTSQSDSHSSGYSFSSGTVASSQVNIKMTISGDTATGTWTAADDSDRSWSESDTWEANLVGLDSGQIPSAQYLVYDFTEGKGKNTVTIEGAPLSNRFDGPDCSGECTLNVVSSCSGSVEFTAVKAGFEDDDVYDYLDGAGQPYGS